MLWYEFISVSYLRGDGRGSLKGRMDSLKLKS